MLVGFHGKLGSGKDTAAGRLAGMVDAPSEHHSFARKLKQSAAALWGVEPSLWETLKNDPEARVLLVTDSFVDSDGYETGNVLADFTIREHLQRYGTESHRMVFDTDFWVDAALDYDFEAGTLYLFTDVRFTNEAQAIRRFPTLPGVIVRVLGDLNETGIHASEVPLADGLVDFVLENHVRDDDFRHLDAQLRSLAETLHLPLLQGVTG